MKTLPLVLLLIAFISCSSDDVTIISNDLANLNQLVIFQAVETQPVENPFLHPAISANIDGESFLATTPSSFDGGLTQRIRGTDFQTGASISLIFHEIATGIYTLSDSSGFTKAFYNGIECSKGEVKILQIENDRISGTFAFEVLDGARTILISNGEFYDIPYTEDFEIKQNHFISATINGEPWEAEVFDGDFLAASFIIRGFNKTGNVQLAIGTSPIDGVGIFELEGNQNNFTGLSFTIAKKQPVINSGFVIVEDNENDVQGRFEAELEGYSIRNGRFHFDMD